MKELFLGITVNAGILPDEAQQIFLHRFLRSRLGEGDKLIFTLGGHPDVYSCFCGLKLGNRLAMCVVGHDLHLEDSIQYLKESVNLYTHCW